MVGLCLPDETLASCEEPDAEPQQLGLFGIVPRKPVKREVRG